MSSTKEVSEERMRVLTSKEIDEISAGICPACIIPLATVGASFLFGASGATLAFYTAENFLLIGASGLALTLSLTTGIWFLNSESEKAKKHR